MTEIGYTEGEKKQTPIIEEGKDLRDAAIKNLEKSQAAKQIKAEAGIIEIPKTEEQIPKELPKYIFKVASKSIECPRMQIDDDEAKLISKHVSILTGNINSKIFSLIIIIIVVLSKVSDCWTAITSKFSKKKKDEQKEPVEIYNEMKEK